MAEPRDVAETLGLAEAPDLAETPDLAGTPGGAGPPPFTLPHTECHMLPGPGGDYALWLAIPPMPAPPGGFPLLLLLDANASFATLVEMQRRGAQRSGATRIGACVVAGIAYPGAAPYHQRRRAWDYTAGPAVAEATPHPAGGAAGFLAFLLGAVAACITTRCATDPGQRVLIGHSLGGFFVLDVLARQPAAFTGYVAVSPSVWWDPARLREGLAARSQEISTAQPRQDPAARRWPAPGRPAPRLAVGVGAWEQELAPWEASQPEAAATLARRARRAMVDNARAIAATAAAQGAETRFDRFPEETHGSVLPVALGRALRFVLAPRGGAT